MTVFVLAVTGHYGEFTVFVFIMFELNLIRRLEELQFEMAHCATKRQLKACLYNGLREKLDETAHQSFLTVPII